MRAHRSRGNRGFTLVEVLVALLITLAALHELYAGIATAIAITDRYAGWQQAVSRAESRLAAIDNPGAMPAEQSGEDDSGFAWRTRVQLLGTAPAPRAGVRAGAWSNGTALYGIEVLITWSSAYASHRYVLSSARLGTARGTGP